MTRIQYLSSPRYRSALINCLSKDPIDTKAAIASVLDFDSSLILDGAKRLLNEACNFGIARKPCDRYGRQTGELVLTPLGAWWLMIAEQLGDLDDDDKPDVYVTAMEMLPLCRVLRNPKLPKVALPDDAE